MEARPLFFGKDISALSTSTSHVVVLLDDAESLISEISSDVQEIANDLQFTKLMILGGVA